MLGRYVFVAFFFLQRSDRFAVTVPLDILFSKKATAHGSQSTQSTSSQCSSLLICTIRAIRAILAASNPNATPTQNTAAKSPGLPTMRVGGHTIIDHSKCSQEQINTLTPVQICTTAEVVSNVNYGILLGFIRHHAPDKEAEIPNLFRLYNDDTRGMQAQLYQEYGVLNQPRLIM